MNSNFSFFCSVYLIGRYFMHLVQPIFCKVWLIHRSQICHHKRVSSKQLRSFLNMVWTLVNILSNNSFILRIESNSNSNSNSNSTQFISLFSGANIFVTKTKEIIKQKSLSQFLLSLQNSFHFVSLRTIIQRETEAYSLLKEAEVWIIYYIIYICSSFSYRVQFFW
jgi:hypothetical protein